MWSEKQTKCGRKERKGRQRENPNAIYFIGSDFDYVCSLCAHREFAFWKTAKYVQVHMDEYWVEVGKIHGFFFHFTLYA